MARETERKRQNRSPELMAQILAECERPGASVAKVALAHGFNANLVHDWRRLNRERRQTEEVEAAAAQAPEASATPLIEAVSFMPVALATSTSPIGTAIEIELRRGPLTMKASWPLSAATVADEARRCLAWILWIEEQAHAYLKDVLTKLPAHPNRRIDELLPHRWMPVA